MKRAILPALVLAALGGGTVAFTQSFPVTPGGRKGPAQPVAFSHEVHAGKLGMDCLYCHYGADKSSIANLPPVSTCMGCHRLTLADRPEVIKLAGYYERGEQVPWAEVYRLPGHVKFNHKRHLKAGIACQDCHGPVEKMPVVYQFPSLKMGWCLSCHRKEMNHPKFPASTDCLICHH